jgi:peptidoglycan/xylan/chitin deacetylase (PgdA/CDA1 family)
MWLRRLLGTTAAGLFMAGLLINPVHAAAKPYCERVKCIALTFDDGPSRYTSTLLDTLRKYDAKATFFLVGRQVQKYPDLVKRMAARGHEIGNHTWSHPHLSELFEGEIDVQLTKTQDIIRKTVGKRPAIMRPPFGETDQRVAAVAAELGLPQILWTGSTRDWASRDADAITERTLALARRNGIILLHDTEPETVKAVPRILRALKKQGYRFVPATWVFRGEALTPGEIYPPR